MNDKCNHCPLLNKDKECAGQKTAKLCDYTNPEHKLYNVNYISMLNGEPVVRPVSIINKIINYTKSTINHAANDFEETPPEIIKERRSICSGCPMLIIEKDECGACGCPIEKKIRRASEPCPLPIPKWLAVPKVIIQTPPPPSTGGCGCGK